MENNDDVPSLYLENVNGANGLKAIKGDLIYAQGTSLLKADTQKKITKIAEVPQPMDGIEPVGNGDFRYCLGRIYILCSRQRKIRTFTGYPPGKKEYGGHRL